MGTQGGGSEKERGSRGEQDKKKTRMRLTAVGDGSKGGERVRAVGIIASNLRRRGGSNDFLRHSG